VARRLAYLVMLSVGATYPRILLGLIVTDFLLTLIVPSGVARIVIMAAIALGLVEAFGAARGSNIGRGMFLVLTYAAALFDKMIIAGASAITARGIIEKVGEVEVTWSLWFIAYLPCSLLTILIAWWLALWLFPPEKAALAGGSDYLREELRRMGPWRPLEKRSAALLGVAIALWVTDSFHHISPATIGLGVGLLAVVPRIGVLEVEDVRRMNYLPVFFVAAAISMGEVLSATKALDLLTTWMFGWMGPLMTNVYSSIIVLYWTAFAYHIVLASDLSMLGTSLPLLMNFAKTHGMNPLSLGMIWTFASGGKIFAYQSAVLILGYSYGYFSARDLFRLGFLITIAEFLIVLVLVPFYWPLVGIR
jgi:anion transporter